MDHNEIKQRIAAVRTRQLKINDKIEDLFIQNKMQRQRLISYEDQLMAMAAEIRSLEKLTKNKRKFSILNLFKSN